MKSKLIILIIIHFFSFQLNYGFSKDIYSLSSSTYNNIYNDMAACIVNYDAQYQRAMAEYRASSIIQMQKDLEFLPKISINQNYSISKNDFLGEQSAINLQISLLEELPFGGFMQLQTNQNLYLPNKDATNYTYNPNFNSNIYLPYLFNQDIAIYNYSLNKKLKMYEKDVAYWSLLQAYINAQHNGIEKVGKYLLTKMTVKNYENREQLLKMQAEDDEKLLKLGKLSFIDISKRDRERFQNTADLEMYRAVLKEYENYIDDLHIKNVINDVDIEIFLEYWDKISKDDLYMINISEKIDSLRNMKQLNQDCIAVLSSEPNLTVTATLNPQSENYGNISPWITIKNYWERNINFSWSVSASLAITIDPSISLLKSREIFNSKQRVYEYKQIELQKSVYESKLRRESTYVHLKEEITIAEKIYQLEKYRTQLAQDYVVSGRLSILDYKLQECILEDARIVLLESRLNYLLSAISPDRQ